MRRSRARFGREDVLLVMMAAAAVFVLAASAGSTPTQCASHSLDEQDAVRAAAVARAVLPPPAHLVLTDACWNPDSASAGFETRRTLTREGVHQWQAIVCRRDVAAWTCGVPAFKQFVVLKLQSGGQSHTAELRFDQATSLKRARALASRALTLYADRSWRQRNCGPGAEFSEGTVSHKRHAKAENLSETWRVSITRDGSSDSVTLDDFNVGLSFDTNADPSKVDSSCWNTAAAVD